MNKIINILPGIDLPFDDYMKILEYPFHKLTRKNDPDYDKSILNKRKKSIGECDPEEIIILTKGYCNILSFKEYYYKPGYNIQTNKPNIDFYYEESGEQFDALAKRRYFSEPINRSSFIRDMIYAMEYLYNHKRIEKFHTKNLFLSSNRAKILLSNQANSLQESIKAFLDCILEIYRQENLDATWKYVIDDLEANYNQELSNFLMFLESSVHNIKNQTDPILLQILREDILEGCETKYQNLNQVKQMNNEESINLGDFISFLESCPNPREDPLLKILKTINSSRSLSPHEPNLRSKKQISNSSEDFQDRVFGCIIGAFLGDSIGSYLEFTDNVTLRNVESALKMKGGGPFEISPGQVTDDSELAISLLYGLVEGKGCFSLDRIAKYYRLWILSPPFDIGRTTSNSLNSLKIITDIYNIKGWCDEPISQSKQKNLDSQSNGGLMRITPLAIWCSKLDDINDIKEVITVEQSLTHPNEIIHLTSIAYCLAIRSLLGNNGDKNKAMKDVGDWVRKQNNKELNEWWRAVVDSPLDKKLLRYDKSIGWVKIAWTYSFIVLRYSEIDFLTAMKMVLANGGDTDTNACIVGGLIGAAIGYKNLQKQCTKQIKTLFECDTEKGNQPRPRMYRLDEVCKKICELMRILPKKLNLCMNVGNEKCDLYDPID